MPVTWSPVLIWRGNCFPPAASSLCAPPDGLRSQSWDRICRILSSPCQSPTLSCFGVPPVALRFWSRTPALSASFVRSTKRSSALTLSPGRRLRPFNLSRPGSMSGIDELVRANHEYAKTFDLGDLPIPPARKLAIVTCMDSRIFPSRAFGLKAGDAHIIRNAGGRAREALRSLVISQRLMGTNEVAIIHHTDCGSLRFTNDDIHAKVTQD